MNEFITLIADKTDEGKRIDAYIAAEAEELSRSRAAFLIGEGRVLRNGKVCKKNDLMKSGDCVEIEIPQLAETDILPEDIPIETVYENNDFAVINKKQGMVVHPAGGVRTGTLVNALLFRFRDLSGINGEIRPGIVHRLDKDTSGLMVIAKNDTAHRALAAQIASKECRRVYYALLEGVVKEDEGMIDMPIGRSRKDRKKMAVDKDGKSAVTLFNVLERFRNNTLMRFELKTGRTHQIRVHAKYIGHPVVGDPVYGYATQRFRLNGQLLHSKELYLTDMKGECMKFESELPDYFTCVLDILEKTEKTGSKKLD